jgi:hypothetical protein
MPRELEFKFMIYEGHDTQAEAARADLELRGATRTINERRSQLGLPLLDTPAADQPMLVAGAGVFLFTPDGIVNVTTAAGSAEELDPDTNPVAPQPDKQPVPAPGAEEKPNTPVPAGEGKVEPTPSKSDKAGVPSKSEVKDGLSKLKVLPNAAGEHPISDNPDKLADTVASPWPIVETNDGSYAVSPDVWSKAQLTLVNIKELYGTDTSLDRSNVADHIEAMGQALTPYRSYALVYNDGEKNIIIDGHHRLFAMWLLGMDQVPVWLGTPDMAKAASDEVKAFLKWAKKGGANRRDFVFLALDSIVGEALNKCAFDGDLDTAKALARAYLT